MKRTFALVIALLCLISITSCTNHKNPSSPLALKQPSLTVSEISGSIEAMKLSYLIIEQSYSSSNTFLSGTQSALKSHYKAPVLNITPTNTSSQPPFDAFLIFDVAPDEVRVRCWESNVLDDADAENKAETIAATKDLEGNFVVKLKSGEYLYEVLANWNTNAEFVGQGFYTFKSSSADPK